MNETLKKLVDEALSKRVFEVDNLSGYKSKKDMAGICDCSDDDDDGGCSN